MSRFSSTVSISLATRVSASGWLKAVLILANRVVPAIVTSKSRGIDRRAAVPSEGRRRRIMIVSARWLAACSSRPSKTWSPSAIRSALSEPMMR